MKVPTSLLVTEGESFDASGEAGELASYYVSITSLNSRMLLLRKEIPSTKFILRKTCEDQFSVRAIGENG